MSNIESPNIIVALDFASAAEALALVDRLSPALCRLKVGNQLFTSAGPELVKQLIGRGFDVFLDLKFHDIPNTVAAACCAAVELGVWMLNVHASGGRAMLAAARSAVDAAAERRGRRPPLLIAVTVLTSLDAAALAETGIDTVADAQTQVLRLARLSQAAGLDGVVCSAQEVPLLRRELGSKLTLVTPGIRGGGINDTVAADDQRRVVSAADALRAGASYLVIGRPVTRAADPLAVLRALPSTTL